VSLAAENLRDNVLKIASEFTSTPLEQCRLVDGAVECGSRSIALSELFESVPDARHRLSVMRKAYGSPRTTCFNVHGFRIAVNRITGEIRILQSVHAATPERFSIPCSAAGRSKGRLRRASAAVCSSAWSSTTTEK
jgi:CO/xanthine dehydrogenase Mo-binding subunit